MKVLIKACFSSSDMWRVIGLPRDYVGVCAGSCSVGRMWKKWTDTMKECLRKRGLDAGKQGEWWRLVRGNAWGIAQEMNP